MIKYIEYCLLFFLSCFFCFVLFFIKLVQDQGNQNVVSYAREVDKDMVVVILPTRTQFCVGNKWFR